MSKFKTELEEMLFEYEDLIKSGQSDISQVALQQQSLGLQLKQIEAQNRLANAEATKTIAEANKIAGVDTKGQELQNPRKQGANCNKQHNGSQS